MESIKILVAEDEPNMGKHIRKCLERSGFQVVGMASTGMTAIAAAAELRPDLVLMDIVLSGEMDGIETAVKMRFDLNIPVIFLSGSHDEPMLERAIKAEPIGYLLKPFDPNTLHTTIESSLHQYKAARERAQKSLEKAEEQFRVMFNRSVLGMFRLSASGTLLNANESLARILGFQDSAELLANTAIGGGLYESPESRRMLLRKLAADGAVNNYETQVRRRDGTLTWVSIGARLIRDDKGKTECYEGTVQEISENKKLQLERDQMEVVLRQAQKLESIGQLAAGIAHEINTPTQYVGDNVRFLKDAFGDIEMALDVYRQLLESCKNGSATEETIRNAEEQIQAVDLEYLRSDIPRAIAQTLEGVERVATIVGAMKEFSHPGKKEKITVDIHKAIKSTLIVCRNEYKYVADMKTDFDPAMPLVPCISGDLNQVIMNLVVNAAHAIADSIKGQTETKGEISISTRRDGDWAEIRVSDSGMGIPEGIRGKIFDPFFTTKEAGKGTGQGLAICHAVITKKHGGTITFETKVGNGTTFIIRLPLSGGDRQSEAA
jgi:PAS domain S-box-containing protein